MSKKHCLNVNKKSCFFNPNLDLKILKEQLPNSPYSNVRPIGTARHIKKSKTTKTGTRLLSTTLLLRTTPVTLNRDVKPNALTPRRVLGNSPNHNQNNTTVSIEIVHTGFLYHSLVFLLASTTANSQTPSSPRFLLP